MKKTKRKKVKNTQWTSPQYIGQHIIAEFWQCQNSNSTQVIKEALLRAVKACRAELLALKIHRFSPKGISGIAMIGESHISLHTWPENDYMAIDIFTCGQKVKPYLALEALKKIFQPKHLKIIKLKRGMKPR